MPDERAITTAASQSDLRERIDGALRPIFGDYVWFGQVVDAVAPLVESENALVVREEHDRLRRLIEALPLIDGDQGPLYNGGYGNALHDVLALLGESTQERASE